MGALNSKGLGKAHGEHKAVQSRQPTSAHPNGSSGYKPSVMPGPHSMPRPAGTDCGYGK